VLEQDAGQATLYDQGIAHASLWLLLWWPLVHLDPSH